MPITPVNEQARIAEQVGRIRATIEDAIDRARAYPERLSDAQIEAMRFQAESNAYAEKFPRFASARSAAMHRLVIPLAPGSIEPLVDPSEASSDARTLFEWFQKWPEANVGAVVGRVGNLIAIHVQDQAAAGRLRALAEYEVTDPDTTKTWTENREINGARVYFQRPAQPARLAEWGKKNMGKALREWHERNRNPEESYVCWSYPSLISGQDAFNFKHKRVDAGLTMLGEGEVVPWAGTINGMTISAPFGLLGEIPSWLGAMLGKPRSRMAMEAAREAYEAAQRLGEVHVIAAAALRREREEIERQRLIEDKLKAEAALVEAMKGER